MTSTFELTRTTLDTTNEVAYDTMCNYCGCDWTASRDLYYNTTWVYCETYPDGTIIKKNSKGYTLNALKKTFRNWAEKHADCHNWKVSDNNIRLKAA